MQKLKFSTVASAVAFSSAAAALLCLSQAAAAVEIAPYFHAWEQGTLTQAQQTAGLNSATLAFAITNGSCAFQSDLLTKLVDARKYVAAGGQLRISLGGQLGIYAEIACKSDDQLFSILDKLIIDSGTRKLDFDVEGHQLLNVEGTNRRTRVLSRLQAKYPDLYVSFTLPGWLRGVSAESFHLLKSTAAAGVKIDMINVMTMSFGLENLRTMVVNANVAEASITTFRAAAAQVATIYPNKSPSQINAMMGMTPMIGKNDDGSVFSLTDAQRIADFVKLNGIGLLSYWSFQRDRAQSSNASTNLGAYSGVAQADYAYYKIFKTAADYTVPAPAPTPAPAPAPVPAPAPAPGSVLVPVCSNSAWVQGKQYAAGSIVSYGGKLYIAKFANPGFNPTISTYYWSAYFCSGQQVALTPTPTPSPVAACKNSTKWVQGRYYAASSFVTYGGRTYVATHANPGYDPTISSHFWARYTCR